MLSRVVVSPSEIFAMDFFKFRTRIKPAKGRLLISEPFLPDPNFERTIVLLCEHNQDGSFGFILNKPADSKVSEVMEELDSFDEPILIGGPVQQDTLHYVHQSTEVEDAVEVAPGIYWGGRFDQIRLMVETHQLKGTDIKFFLGYSGWDKGQLDEELKADSWMVTDVASVDFLFDTPARVLWTKSLKAMGGRFSMYSNYPIDPRFN
jgi:putative transcriptional regulator